MSSTALYDERMSKTAKSIFIRGRRTFGGLLRRARAALAETLSATSAVSGGAAEAVCEINMTPPVIDAEAIVEIHLLREILN